jgi:hypothetical protein
MPVTIDLGALIGSSWQLLDTGKQISGGSPAPPPLGIAITPNYAASSPVLDVTCPPDQ